MNKADYIAMRNRNVLGTSNIYWNKGKLPISLDVLNRINIVKLIEYEERGELSNMASVFRYNLLVPTSSVCEVFINLDMDVPGIVLSFYLLLHSVISKSVQSVEDARLELNKLIDPAGGVLYSSDLVRRINFFTDNTGPGWFGLMAKDLSYVYSFLNLFNSIPVYLRPKICAMDYCDFVYYGTADRKYCCAHHRSEILSHQKRVLRSKRT